MATGDPIECTCTPGPEIQVGCPIHDPKFREYYTELGLESARIDYTSFNPIQNPDMETNASWQNKGTTLEPSTFEEAVTQTVTQLGKTVISKQKDYGKANISIFGEHGILVRTNDKFERLKNLILNSKDPSNESLDDNWADLAGYSIVALLWRKGWWELPMDG